MNKINRAGEPVIVARQPVSLGILRAARESFMYDNNISRDRDS
jgi:hypothetical protein